MESNDIFFNTATKLLAITEGCRHDMHEPDNQGITARVVGNHLDNAMGDNPDYNCGEFTIIMERDGEVVTLNLADILALARYEAYDIVNPDPVKY